LSDKESQHENDISYVTEWYSSEKIMMLIYIYYFIISSFVFWMTRIQMKALYNMHFIKGRIRCDELISSKNKQQTVLLIKWP
jgi:hypothetical protein